MAPEWLNLVHFFPRDFDFLINLTTKPCSRKGQKTDKVSVVKARGETTGTLPGIVTDWS